MSLYSFNFVFYHLNVFDILNLSKVNIELLNIYRKLNIRRLISYIHNCNDKLKFYILFYNHLPKQGSELWLSNRVTTIGGSEMYDLIYNTRKLIEQKLSITKFGGNIYTRFGNAFEDVIANIIDVWLKTKSYETGSIPGLVDCNGNVVQTYSPDRILTCKRDRLDKLINSKFNSCDKEYIEMYNEMFCKTDDVVVLNEFKCPPMRAINGSIPSNYVTQPATGVCTIPFIDISLFIDSAFRKSSLDQFKFNSCYDTYFHNKPNNEIKPIFIGAIYFYTLNDNDVKYDLSHIKDLGLLNTSDFNNLLNDNKVYYPNTFILPTFDIQSWLNKTNDDFIKYCNDNNFKPIGILPWKLFKIAIIPVLNDLSFLDNHKQKIFDTINLIKLLKEKFLIKKQLNQDLVDVDYYIKKLDKKFSKKIVRKYNRKPKESKESKEPKNFFNANDFNDLL